MRRRRFIAVAGGAAASPLLARAQPRTAVVGFLSTRSPEEAVGHTNGFLQGLSDGGFTESNNLTLVSRWARGNYGSLPALAADLVAAKPAVLAAGGDPAALALKATATNIPIAFLIGDDPVRIGLVASLNRPGGNATGVSLITSALGEKRLEILTQIVPSARIVALLVNPANPNAGAHTLEVQAAAAAMKRNIVVTNASGDAQLEEALPRVKRQGANALLVQNDPFFDSRRERLVAIVARLAMPAMFHIREFPAAGGLVSYGPSLVSAYRDLGLQAARLLKGANPQHLPVVRPNTFELVINIKAAKALGLAVPQAVVVSADEVIE